MHQATAKEPEESDEEAPLTQMEQKVSMIFGDLCENKLIDSKIFRPEEGEAEDSPIEQEIKVPALTELEVIIRRDELPNVITRLVGDYTENDISNSDLSNQ